MDIKIGHYTDEINKTGCTVFVFEQAAKVGIDIRGSNTATFNTPAFDSKAVMDSLHAIVLTGGSTFGLESCFGVIENLEGRHIGNNTGVATIPAVAGAVIYDLAIGSAQVRPTKKAGWHAAENANSNPPEEGDIGVGTGATTGKWVFGERQKGGFSMATTTLPEGAEVRAYVVTNAVGTVLKDENELRSLQEKVASMKQYPKDMVGLIGTNTTLAVVATNVELSKDELQKVAELAHDGMARAIYPIHTNLDGDVVFAVSVGPKVKLKLPSDSRVDIIGLAAADTLERAIRKSIY